MSINVTVHGNPISVRRGKMVTVDTDKEFERRRRIRLQQVRHQSKVIAEEVRNRVRKERNKQLSKADETNERKIKHLQATKLDALRQHHKNCMHEFGRAHTSANEEPNDELVLSQINKTNNTISQDRGNRANQKRKIDKKLQDEELNKSGELKRATRDVENVRAKMVADIHKSKPKTKRKRIEINVNDVVSDSSFSETDFECSCPCTENEFVCDGIVKDVRSMTDEELQRKIKQLKGMCTERDVHKRLNSKDRTVIPSDLESDCHVDRRISDTIYQRKSTDVPSDFGSKDTHLFESSRHKSHKNNIQTDTETHSNLADMPYVPKVVLNRTIDDDLNYEVQSNKTKYYNHANRFSREYQPPTIIQKISDENIQMQTSRSEEEHSENLHKKQQKTQKRSAKALDKLRIQKNYEILTKELPVLQCQERLASMRLHNPKFHMNRERQLEFEHKQQNEIENIYENYYRKYQLLEQASKSTPQESMKKTYKRLDISESPINIDLENLIQSQNDNDAESKDLKVQEDELVNNQKSLEDLLERINKQRQILMKEANLTVPNDSPKESPKCSCCPNKSKAGDTCECEEDSKKTSKTKRDKAPSLNSSSDSSVVRKKVKKILIKNEGTQTSPIAKENPTKTTEQLVEMDNGNNVSNNSVDSEKLCEIIIKMNDDSNIKISERPTKLPAVNKQKSKLNKEFVLKIKTPEKLPHIINDTSTSTSYMSPPISINPPVISHPPINPSPPVIPHAKKSKNVTSHNKEKKVSSKTESKELDPRIVKYIQKLLNMSRKHLAEMSASSISDISTPGTSIVQTPTNTPLKQLKNVMDHFELNFEDIQKYLSISESSSSVHDRISEYPERSIDSSKSQKSNVSSENQTDAAAVDKILEESIGMNLNDFSELNYPKMVLKYTELAENCCKRITSLAGMIEKVRKEKEKLLSPVHSDSYDNSTSYMDLPKTRISEDKPKDSPKVNENDSNESMSQDAVDRYLLTIDSNQSKSVSLNKSPNHSININISAKTETVLDKKVPPEKDGETFVPFLQGIPKYSNQLHEVCKYVKPRPPPSLKPRVDMIPHELSTIVEVDSLASTRVSEVIVRKVSPEKKSKNDSWEIRLGKTKCSPCSDKSDCNKENVDAKNKCSPLKKCSPKKKSLPNSPDKSQIASPLSGIQLISSSSSSGEDMEGILRSLGLGWAVATLKKTQEALALSSSSSSLENTKKTDVKPLETSSSDVSLKDLLKKEFFKKLSSSSSSSQKSSLLLLDSFSELQELSAIPGTSTSKDKSLHRTSTPMQNTRNTDSKSQSHELFQGDTDLSSVKNNSDENMFLSIPNLSLDTSKSVNRSKK